MSNWGEEIDRAVDVLRNGGSLLYPTDTIWGLGCDATNKKAVKKLHKIKKRSDQKSFIILLEDAYRLQDYLEEVPLIATELMAQITSPLTIVYPGARNLAKNVISEDGSIGIRIPRDGFVKELLEAFGKPIVSTSANLSGDPPPQSFREIHPDIIAGVDYAVDMYRDRIKETKPSTIIRILEKGGYEILRR